ncbi:50S ribosomal protein L25 [Rubrivirga sp. IMCC43871]|uniref:50S ribosomal protein L25 n=1 Tax=Rubrivirga sp. IMCC43871 TaxID=3391575 RepID=UPI0039901F95
MQSITLDTQTRETGKTATKAVRREGLVPCVLYGSHTEPVHFSVETLALRPLIFTTETYRVAITAGGDDHEAILKHVDFHPVTDTPIHADFLALTAGELLTMVVPIRLEGAPRGVKAGGILSQPINELEIRALPKDIPGHISIDVSKMDVNESIHVEELDLGEDIEILTELSRTIATVTVPRVVVVEEDEAVSTEMAEGLEAPADGEDSEGDEA